MKGGLESSGVSVWFDKHTLKAGEHWEMEIDRNINNCSLFIPLISANTENTVESYFWREWRLATERASRFAPGTPFILPVVIDETRQYGDTGARIFRDVQWSRLPNGEPTAAFVDSVRQLVRDYWKRKRA
jgi:hypothetical protein